MWCARTYAQVSSSTINEYIVALDVSMYDMVGMQKLQAAKNLATPPLHRIPPNHRIFPQVTRTPNKCSIILWMERRILIHTYSFKDPDDMISVMKMICSFSRSTQELKYLITFLCSISLRSLTSVFIRFLSFGGTRLSFTTFQATSMPLFVSYARNL
jgi:hypothetical protein